MNKSSFGAPLRILRHSAALIILTTTVLGGIFGIPGPALAQHGYVQVGFTGTIVNSSSQPSQRFKNVFLNITQVRINSVAGAAPTAVGWNSIPAANGLNPQSLIDFQIDLNNIQNVPQLFNYAIAFPTTYMQVEVDLDPANPGKIVPVCPSNALGTLEGCAPYTITPSPSTGFAFTLPSPGLSVTANQLTTLIINLSLTVTSAPTTFGSGTSASNYAVTITGAQASPQQLGFVSGVISGGSGITPNQVGIRNLAVIAETAGTNEIVSTVFPDQGGNYSIQLPAAPNVGSYYDIYVTGGAVTYGAQRLPPLFPGSSVTQDFTVTPKQTLGTISGKVSDACTNKPIIGAVLQLLMPPVSLLQTTPTFNCALAANAPQCVSIGTANSDVTGTFPLQGQTATPGIFNNVPLVPAGGQPYALEVSAPGYDTTYTSAVPQIPPNLATAPVRTGGLCGAPTPNGSCDFDLTSGQLAGSVSLVAPLSNSQTVVVQVFAEQSGTHNLMSALTTPLVFQANTQTQNFTMTVPTSPAAFDLYATAIDLFYGVTDPYAGHDILVKSAVPGFSGTVPSCSAAPVQVTFPPEDMTCTGHGSISGIFNNPTAYTTAMLSKADSTNSGLVQIVPVGVQGPVSQIGSTPPNPTFSFCVPGDSYSVQRYDVPIPSSTGTPSVPPTPAAVGSPVAAMVPLPTSQATPCPTTCFEDAPGSQPNTCPSICNGQQLSSPL